MTKQKTAPRHHPRDGCRICRRKIRPHSELCPQCSEIELHLLEIDQKLHRAAHRTGGPDYHDREYHGGRFGSGEW